jgi:hypothetical protein
MVQSRRQRKADEELAELRPVGFTPLAALEWEDSGYLPLGGDQSWREREALRISAYDRIGYLPPQDDQSWREWEVLRLGAARDESATDDQDDEQQEPVLESDSAGVGRGGIVFALFVVVGLLVVAFAPPGSLSADFWRARWAASMAKPAAMPVRVADMPAPAPPADRLPPPQSQPAPADGPALKPSLNTEPAENAMPEAVPSPRPETRASRRGAGGFKTMVIGADGTVKYENAGSKRGPARRVSVHDDHGMGGFYAMAPGPDGILRRAYFHFRQETVARPSARSDRGAGGFYAMAPGPDGTLRYQYFPSRPSR